MEHKDPVTHFLQSFFICVLIPGCMREEWWAAAFALEEACSVSRVGIHYLNDELAMIICQVSTQAAVMVVTSVYEMRFIVPE